jgi:hypothetical protein
MVWVGQWAFKMFASALSVREYQPDLRFKYTEQNGMEEMIKRVSLFAQVYAPRFLHKTDAG